MKLGKKENSGRKMTILITILLYSEDDECSEASSSSSFDLAASSRNFPEPAPSQITGFSASTKSNLIQNLIGLHFGMSCQKNKFISIFRRKVLR